MPILNYTTTIAVSKTVGEIQDILARGGVTRIIIEYGQDKIPTSIYFEVEVNDRVIQFRLPSRWSGVWKTLYNSNVERKYRTEDQAKRVAWRIIKDWTEAQLAMIDAGAAELAEVFFPYIINPTTGQSLFAEFSQLQLGTGEMNEHDT